MTETPQAARFRKMADAIDHNGVESFGGAFVVVPPKDGGEPIETLILDSTQDPIQMWGILRVKCEMIIQDLEAKRKQRSSFGR